MRKISGLLQVTQPLVVGTGLELSLPDSKSQTWEETEAIAANRRLQA